MANPANGTPENTRTCEECAASGAQPVRVEFGDAKTITLHLCEACFREFRDADLIGDASVLNADTLGFVQ